MDKLICLMQEYNCVRNSLLSDEQISFLETLYCTYSNNEELTNSFNKLASIKNPFNEKVVSTMLN